MTESAETGNNLTLIVLLVGNNGASEDRIAGPISHDIVDAKNIRLTCKGLRKQDAIKLLISSNPGMGRLEVSVDRRSIIQGISVAEQCSYQGFPPLTRRTLSISSLPAYLGPSEPKLIANAKGSSFIDLGRMLAVQK